jgi:hypothetical protein
MKPEDDQFLARFYQALSAVGLAAEAIERYGECPGRREDLAFLRGELERLVSQAPAGSAP